LSRRGHARPVWPLATFRAPGGAHEVDQCPGEGGRLLVGDEVPGAGDDELVLGRVRTRGANDYAEPGWITANQVGAVAVAASASAIGGREIVLRNQGGLAQALALLQGTQLRPASPIVALSTMAPKKGRRDDLVALLAETRTADPGVPGRLRYSVHSTHRDDHGPLQVIQEFTSTEARFSSHRPHLLPGSGRSRPAATQRRNPLSA
jgi:hypothetical protein